jgi:hypothetical protein
MILPSSGPVDAGLSPKKNREPSPRPFLSSPEAPGGREERREECSELVNSWFGGLVSLKNEGSGEKGSDPYCLLRGGSWELVI